MEPANSVCSSKCSVLLVQYGFDIQPKKNKSKSNDNGNKTSESFHQELRKQLRINEFQINDLFYAN